MNDKTAHWRNVRNENAREASKVKRKTTRPVTGKDKLFTGLTLS